MATNPAPVADITLARLDRFAAERSSLMVRLAALDARESAFCRQWSGNNGYRVLLRADQVRRAVEGARG